MVGLGPVTFSISGANLPFGRVLKIKQFLPDAQGDRYGLDAPRVTPALLKTVDTYIAAHPSVYRTPDEVSRQDGIEICFHDYDDQHYTLDGELRNLIKATTGVQLPETHPPLRKLRGNAGHNETLWLDSQRMIQWLDLSPYYTAKDQ